jgi:penicillin-binding protein 1A
MAGKTGTTNDNADFWFMGYTPQLLAGVWVGCDDRFIQIQSGAYMGGTAARPIWEAFFKKVYADQSLGIRKDAEFSKPADMSNDINGANDIMFGTDSMDERDNGMNENDYLDTTNYNIPPESQPPVDEDAPVKDNKSKKDTVKTKIGEMSLPEDPKKDKKGNFLQRVFGKNKNKDGKKGNDY